MGELIHMRPELQKTPEPKESANKEILKKVGNKLRLIRNIAIAGVLGYGAATEVGTAGSKAVDYSRFDNKSVAGKMGQGAEVVTSTALGTILEAEEDISDRLNEMGMEEEADSSAEEITLKESMTLQQIAEFDIQQEYMQNALNKGIEASRMGPILKTMAHKLARHWARLNNIADTETVLEVGTKLTIDHGFEPNPNSLAGNKPTVTLADKSNFHQTDKWGTEIQE